MNRRRSGVASLLATILRSGTDLVVPTICGGCDTPGSPWCPDCAATLADTPIRLEPRIELPVDAWALGRYRGPYRRSLVSVKEHDRRDLIAPLGRALARGVITLGHWGEIPDGHTLTLIPAPTRRSSARRRGGDPVASMSRVAAGRLGPRVRSLDLLVTSSWARDSVGLDARRRVGNLSGAIRLRYPWTDPGPATSGAVVLVDDILTTGATSAESVRVLAWHGVTVHAVLVVAGA
ncbi:ComF family protein [Gordonia sp. ABSL11-1]|uniref:ComF family protein n=1 Tax=Gordonia sp. ABSL11-1 TaxID=3053924 RepID=UPI00257307AB|nr:ComF family protein [Gordonia sp. ABSL11-1]MDL9945004.1 ComF family protein [Gordonia sp. ABSL11-1]